ncbi:MAG TPA: transporter [Kiritimatiellia bacterium]
MKILFSMASILMFLVAASKAQDLEPRRWSHLPVGANFVGAAYSYTHAQITFDPVLEVDDVTLDLHTAAIRYTYSFELLDHQARVEGIVPYQDAQWEGLLQGEPATRQHTGMADPMARFAVNLVGSPPLKGPAFAEYQKAHPVQTIVGAGVSVQAPLGQYYDDKLLNIGDNRYAVRSELGAVHSHGKWSEELTGSIWCFTDNDEFYPGTSTREQEPLYVVQAHLVYTFRPGLWLSCGVANGTGGESFINDVAKNDEKDNVLMGISGSYPINRNAGIKLGYMKGETHTSTGADSDTVMTALAVSW